MCTLVHSTGQGLLAHRQMLKVRFCSSHLFSKKENQKETQKYKLAYMTATGCKIHRVGRMLGQQIDGSRKIIAYELIEICMQACHCTIAVQETLLGHHAFNICKVSGYRMGTATCRLNGVLVVQIGAPLLAALGHALRRDLKASKRRQMKYKS